MSYFLLNALWERKEGSYEDWLGRTQAAYARASQDERLPRLATIAAQGPLRQPLFAPGPGDTTLRLLLAGYQRRRHNLDLALDLLTANKDLLCRPEDQLTKAALLVRSAELERGHAADKTGGNPGSDLIKALGALDEYGRTAGDMPIDELEVYVGLRTSTLSLTGQTDQAVDFLLQKVGKHPQLRNPKVADRVAELTQAILDREADERIQKSLRGLDEAGSAATPAAARLRELRAARRGPIDSLPLLPK